jgi:ElaB/YqjD/DUF883 family membrane-anchored ribosome-binding protein/uncharacterized protein YjbJ (UPF0337 family)
MTEQVTTPQHGGDGSQKVEAAKEVAGRAAERASGVAGEAQAQAQVVAGQARDQFKELVDRSRRDLGHEAANRSRQAAGSLRTLAGQVGALADGDPQAAGPLGDLMREGRDRLQAFADRLDDGPIAVFDDVRRFARRQPVLFLATAGALGFVAGRLVRAGREASSTDRSASSSMTASMQGSADSLPPPPVVPHEQGAPVVAEGTTGLGVPGVVVP